MKYSLPVFVLIALLLSLSVHPLLAIKPDTLPTRAQVRAGVTTRPTKADRLSPSPTRNPKNGKLQSCQARLLTIKTRSQNLTDFSNRLIATFDKIATRVQEFYTTKDLSVTNYSTLVADVATKKLAAQTALTKAQAIMAEFNCTSGDPKANLLTFNQEMRLVHTALNSYKTSVRNLIVGVKGGRAEETE